MSEPIRARNLTIGVVVAIVIGFGIMVFASSGGDSGSTQGAGPIDAAVLYGDQCATCHGGDGSGGSGRSLVEGDLTATEIADAVTDGVPGMPAYGSRFSDDEIDAVVEYVMSLGDE